MSNRKSTGIRRRVDEVGRVTIPREIRTAYGINTDTPIQITMQGDEIILEPMTRQRCCVCGNEDAKYQIYPNSWVCKNCMKKIKRKRVNFTEPPSDSNTPK